jgi:hypothetical protein
VIDALRRGELSAPATIEILQATESFLFRRALVGIEPTGLHAAFKNLWNDLSDGNQALGGELLRNVLARKPTIMWPTNKQFEEAIKTGDLYQRKICSFALREYELSLKGESPSDKFVIEHVAPQTMTETWKAAIGEDNAELIQTWGNLIPLTEKMNPSVGQKPFELKRAAFKDSIFATARLVATGYETWTAKTIQDRNQTIAAWALKRWPF